MATAHRSDPDGETLLNPTPGGVSKMGSNRPRGSVIGRYVIIELLGKGGMGAVYSAYDTQLDRRVALKLLRAARGQEPDEWRVRLMREAQAMARLSHPNVVTVYDVGVAEDGQVFLSMEIVDGGTMAGWLKARPRRWREIVAACCDAGDGLAVAHEAGIVHRDFKLENVLIGAEGRPRVTDFGVASIALGEPFPASVASESGDREAASPGLERSSTSTSAPLTLTGAMLGTPGFMAPEQYDSSAEIDARADVFAFCATLHRALYGERPFGGTTVHEIASATFNGQVRPPPKGSDVPMWLRRLMLQGLAVEPAARPASMRELLTALRANLGDPARTRRNWALGALVVTVCAVGAVGWARHAASLRAQCNRGALLMASTWNPAVEERVRRALTDGGGSYATGVAERTIARLSQYAETWTANYRAVAEATLLRGEQSAAMMDRRLRCLERGRLQLEALGDVLAQKDPSILQRAIDAAYRLPPPIQCATSDLVAVPPLPSSPEIRERVRAVERAVARTMALSNAGQDQQVAALVERTLPEVRAIPQPSAEAELLLLLGRTKLGLGENSAALTVYQDALHAAERAADDALASRGASMVAFVLAGYLERAKEGERWLALAEAIASRVGHDDVVEMQLSSTRINVTLMLGERDKALELQDKHNAMTKRLYGEADPRFAMAIMNRAVVASRVGKNEQAVEDAKLAIELLSAATGPDNPHLDLSYISLATPLFSLGRMDEARAAYQHALALQSGRPPGGLTVCILAGLADVEEATGHLDEAIAIAERGISVATAIGDDEVYKWMLMTTRARILGKKGNLFAQIEGCSQALAAQKAHGAVAPDRAYTPDTLKCLGEAELARHRPAAAIAYLEQTARLERRSDASDLPLARFALAQALRAARRDPERAHELATEARNALRPLAGQEKYVETIDKWLEARNSAAVPP